MTPADLPARWRAAFDVQDDGCWIWTQHVRPDGYGQAWLDGVALAHRAVYQLLAGPIPDGDHLHHDCRVRACVNPAHLRPMDPVAHQHLHFVLDGGCSAGHPWTPENTYTRANGQRQCRRCKANRQSHWYLEHAAEDNARRTAHRLAAT